MQKTINVTFSLMLEGPMSASASQFESERERSRERERLGE